MSKGKNQHVVPHPDGWAIKGAGNEKATRVLPTQEKASELARDIAKHQHSELIIHDKKGLINRRNSYGNDPCPPAS